MSSAVHLPRAGALGRASDAQLTRLIRQGDREAFAALYERHAPLVDAVARASSRERAEDIAQETWTSVYRSLSVPGKPIDYVAPWLTTIARNVARDRHRRDTRQPEVVNDDLVATAPARGGVESALEGKHTIGRLLGAFDELSEEQRVILNLREFGGLTYKQIAEQLGKPESTIEAALFRARRKMAKEYAELDSGRRCSVAQSQLARGSQLSHRERRRLTRHLGRCESCERVARLEGADDLIPAPRLARIAGAIPMPAVVARLLSGGANAVSPLVGKTAVAVVAVVAGVGAVVVAEHDGAGPTTARAGSATVQAAVTETSQVSLSTAPNVVLTHRIAVTKRTTAAGATPAISVQRSPTVAASAPVAAAAPKAAPRRTTTSAPVRRTTSPQQPTQAPVPQPAAPPQATPVTAAPAPAQPAQLVQPPAPATPPATPVQQAPAPASSGGPRVTQTATCLVASCRVGG